MVAGAGFEPHDLRVMSPMSYQTALPRDILSLLSSFVRIHLYYEFVKHFMLNLQILFVWHSVIINNHLEMSPKAICFWAHF